MATTLSGKVQPASRKRRVSRSWDGRTSMDAPILRSCAQWLYCTDQYSNDPSRRSTLAAPAPRLASSSSRTPGRPKDPVKRNAIRRAAGELFLERGFERTSMDAVAEAAGVSKNTVYSHFDSKEALFRGVIAHEVDKATQLASATVPDAFPLHHALMLLGGTYQKLLLDDKAVRMFRVVIGESTSHPRVAELFAEAVPAATQTVFERLIQVRHDRGELMVDDVSKAATLLQTMISGNHHMQLLMNLPAPTGAELKEQLERAVETFLAAYARKRS